MSHLPYIPTEVWERILDLLDSQSLLNFQNVCQEWYHITIQYVMSGRLKNRALVSYLLYNSTLLRNNDKQIIALNIMVVYLNALILKLQDVRKVSL